jgi:hypothetical protein
MEQETPDRIVNTAARGRASYLLIKRFPHYDCGRKLIRAALNVASTAF